MMVECNGIEPLSQNYKFWAYCLYMYFMQNQDGFTLKLRRTHAMNVTNLSKSSYHRAMAELIEKGYLIDCGDGYEFYEEPEEEL